MSNTFCKESNRTAGYKAALVALLLAGGSAATAAPVSVALCAKPGASASPAVPTIWGYSSGDCGTALAPTSPGGPVIEATVGDLVTVTLGNGLAETTGILFQGQGIVPDPSGVAAGGTHTYTFTASKPGTYLYQAAPLANAEHQVAMGLHGALVVRPASTTTETIVRSDSSAATVAGSAVVVDVAVMGTETGLHVRGAGIPDGATVAAATPGVGFTLSVPATADGNPVSVQFYSTTTNQTAYDAASAYDDEAIVVLSEIDTGLNNSTDPAKFDMREFGSNALGRGGVPMYYLINGKSYPATTPISTTAGHKLLIRYVNAGAKHHSMGLLGLRQRIIAKDGSLLPTADVAVTAETLAPGQTADALVTIPAVTSASRFALYDASLQLQNRDDPVDQSKSFSGMLTFVSAGSGATVSGPVTSGVSLSTNPSNGSAAIMLSATVTGTNVTGAQYFIDSQSGAPTAMAGAAPSFTANISTATLAGLTPGNHTFYVRGLDANGPGGFGFVVLNLDRVGPTISALSMTPNPAAAGASVTLNASASDLASGGLNVNGAEYSLNGSTWTAFGAFPQAPVVSLTATLAAPATTTTVHVRATDALGNVGAESTATLTVSAQGPTSSIASISPDPANGVQGFNSSTPAVRVAASMTSPSATVAAAEAFFDKVCASTLPAPSGTVACAAGTGIPLVANDGVFNAATEAGYADIPLATIAGATNGAHPVSVHGRDTAGNWGAFATRSFTINRSAPTVNGVTLAPPYTNGAQVAVNVTGTDVGTGNSNITGGEFFIDGGATAYTLNLVGTTASSTRSLTGSITGAMIAGLGEGVHTVSARVRDSAVPSNWSALLGATLIVDRTAPRLVNIAADGPLVTSANSVSFTVNFSEVVSTTNGGGLLSVAANDFLVYRNGAQLNNAQLSVTGSGTTRTVVVSGFNSSTTSIQLRLKSATAGGNSNNRPSITDMAGNVIVNPVDVNLLNGPTYSIVKIAAPVVTAAFNPSSISRTANAAGRQSTYTIGFTNFNAVAMTGLRLQDGMPGNGTLTIPTDPVSSCGGSVTRGGGGGGNTSFTLSGATVPANGNCTLTMTVQLSANAGNANGYNLTDTINVGDVTSDNALPNSQVVATLRVNQ